MANQFEIKITGIKALRVAFTRIGDDVKKRILRKAVRKAAAPILAAAKELVPVRTGLLKRSLGIRVTGRGPLAVNAAIGTSGRAFYAHLVEFGHAIKGGGSVPSQPFIRPAYDANWIRAVSVANDTFTRELIKKSGKP